MSDCCSKKDTIADKKIDLEDLTGLICYCFKKSKKELFEATLSGDEETIVSEIKSKMKNPGCFCETANPSGKCCLSDVNAFIKAVRDREAP